jgi:hypothetical protein
VTITIPPPPPNDRRYDQYNPAHGGCTFPNCGSQATVVVDGRHGRRCEKHAPVSWDEAS